MKHIKKSSKAYQPKDRGNKTPARHIEPNISTALDQLGVISLRLGVFA
ncbi:MAG: hypothetical protein SGJ20_14645 [Planctomycetota bacterium]|nr:hypothetical protein [Planctomycetota bacterium]